MPTIDLAFSIQGTEIPADHGYSLFSAIHQIVPEIHGNKKFGIHPIRGMASGNGTLLLNRSSRLTIRTDADEIKTFLPLAGKSLDIRGSHLRVGIPRIYLLTPAANLHARIVTIKGFLDEASFRDALQRQLDERNVKARIEIGPSRIVRIQDKKVVGFYVRLFELNAEESLRVQENGLGGRRRFGCGIFGKIKEERG